MFYTFISSCFAKLEKQFFYLVINLFLFFPQFRSFEIWILRRECSQGESMSNFEKKKNPNNPIFQDSPHKSFISCQNRGTVGKVK